ncbi:GNAT family N-acetyltransferase [Corynebacterium flavescens]|uniref:GNAT family N-acetyltransferase n=1 Tax=Corynebacterium flavescens TaxID=28028 RepID=UPI003FD598EB
MNTTIEHEPEKSRFVIAVDGEEAGRAEYFDRGSKRDFHHTVIGEKFRGNGLSSTLITAVLDESRQADKKVIPSCPAVSHFIDKHEEYQDLL